MSWNPSAMAIGPALQSFFLRAPAGQVLWIVFHSCDETGELNRLARNWRGIIDVATTYRDGAAEKALWQRRRFSAKNIGPVGGTSVDDRM